MTTTRRIAIGAVILGLVVTICLLFAPTADATGCYGRGGKHCGTTTTTTIQETTSTTEQETTTTAQETTTTTAGSSTTTTASQTSTSTAPVSTTSTLGNGSTLQSSTSTVGGSSTSAPGSDSTLPYTGDHSARNLGLGIAALLSGVILLTAVKGMRDDA